MSVLEERSRLVWPWMRGFGAKKEFFDLTRLNFE